MKRVFVVFLVMILTGGIMMEQASGTSKRAGGIVFLRTKDLAALQSFYRDEIGCEIWLDQGGCVIFRYGNLLVGFCEGDEADLDGVITFFFEDRDEVDRAYRQLEHLAASEPQENKQYRIYHFYARDPEGRSLEFQHFLHPVTWDF